MEFDRPASGFRFKFGGIKTNAAPDALASDKYPLVLNGRAFSDDEMRTRPGMQLLFATGSDASVSNIGSYSQGQGGIRYLAASGGKIYKDDSGTAVDSSFSASQIQAMVPYRPNQSPEVWMYVSDGTSNRKFSFISVTDSLLDQKVGIAEPQVPVDAAIESQYLIGMSDSGPVLTYTHSFPGGGGTNSGITSDDTVIAVFQDPVYAGLPTNNQEYVLTLAPSPISGTYPGSGTYERGKFITVGQPTMQRGVNDYPWQFMVRDVYPPFLGTLSIRSLYYYSGNTGRCVIVPANTGSSSRYGESLYSEQILANLRRGCIVQIDSEQCFVDSVTVGPDGTICFEVTTASTHSNASTITGVYAIKVLFRTYISTYTFPGGAPTTNYTPLPGDTIYGHFYEGDMGVGINTITSSALSPTNPFNLGGVGLQDDDFIHVGIWFADITAMLEVKLLIDVDVAGAGAATAFTQNFYYYSIRPADYVNAIGNTLTQLGAAQLAVQRQILDEEAKKHDIVLSSAQQAPGSGAWAQIFFRLKDMQRVGNDQTRTLMNANSYQLLFNLQSGASSNDAGFHTVDVFGGYSPEVTAQGGDIKYRIRPRSSVTGAKGNPSPPMRYGVRPQRQGVTVVLPTTYADPQVDTWDIFRTGGTLDKYRFVGFVSMGTQYYNDNFPDLAIVDLEDLEFDNLEPWPSIDVPLNGTASVTGTTAVVTPAANSSALIGSYLPGNEIQLGQYVYTLWTRPTQLGSNWLFQFEENATVFASGIVANIYEPEVANQQSRMTWGPTDDGGVIFGLDPLRPGTVSYSKNFNPDSVADGNNLELCPPSEPLMGGCYAKGLVAVGSSARKWLLRPNFQQANKWTPTPIAGGGLASPFGMATDGNTVFAIEKNGITADGVSITTEDLSNMFPIDGVPPDNVLWRGVFRPPDFTKANLFRLACVGGYLYFDYVDLAGSHTTLVYDTKRKGWSVDLSLQNIVVHVPVIQAQFQTSALGTNPVQLLLGDGAGNVYEQVDQVNDAGDAITFRVITGEFAKGDLRANAQWGDVFLSALPSLNNAMTVFGCSGGVDLAASVNAPLSSTRQPIILNSGNPIVFSYGIDVTAVQTFEGGEVAATLYIWEPAYIPQPVVEQGRFQDWDDAGDKGNKFWQGFLLEANTNGVTKSLLARDSDTLASHAFTPAINLAQQTIAAYSFTQPFIAHMVRIEPQDDVNWNLWTIKWIVEPFPESAETWQTEGMTHGLRGYQSVFQVNLAYISTQPVTLTIETDTGQTVTQTFPATGAQLAANKVLVKLPVNKGKVFAYNLTSTAPFYVWKNLCEVWVGEWGRTNEFAKRPLFGGESSENARV